MGWKKYTILEIACDMTESIAFSNFNLSEENENTS